MLAALLGVVAQAHPFGARFAAHLVELDVTEDRLEVRYLADVPNAVVAAGARPGRSPLDDMAEELRSGLLLEVDGRSILLEPTAPYAHVATEDTQQFAWTLAASLEEPPRQVTLSNGNLPDVVSVFRGSVRVGGRLAASACSLWRVTDGLIALDESDRWRTDERHRTLSVTVGPPAGPVTPLWALARGWGSEPVLAAERYLPPLGAALRARTATPGTTSLAGALALGSLGAVGALWRIRRAG